MPDALENLKRGVERIAEKAGHSAGAVRTPISGVRVMRAYRPMGTIHSVYRPVICLVLQGAKSFAAGCDHYTVRAGEAIIVGAHMPVAGRIVEASPNEPYLSIAIEIDLASLGEANQLVASAPAEPVANAVFAESIDDTIISCASRLLRLIDYPAAEPVLRPNIHKELHFWLLNSKHGPVLKQLGLPSGQTQRITRAIEVLRERYREAITIEELARIANLSVSAFHRRFKQITSVSPVQFRRQLRLIEARRLMMAEGKAANHVADLVGYQSASHFSRDFARMFGAPPARDRAARRRAAAAAPPAP